MTTLHFAGWLVRELAQLSNICSFAHADGCDARYDLQVPASKHRQLVLLVTFGFVLTVAAAGCRQDVDGEIAANSGLLGTWRVALTRCVRQRGGGVLLTDRNPCAKKLIIGKSGPSYSVVLSVLSGCNGEWRTVTLSTETCASLEVEMKSENGAVSGRATFACQLPQLGVVQGALRFVDCR